MLLTDFVPEGGYCCQTLCLRVGTVAHYVVEGGYCCQILCLRVGTVARLCA